MKKHLFAIVDIETTGGRAVRDKITEIAIVLHDGEKIIDSFETLINPECPIPYGITELTGISNEMVSVAPKFYEVARLIVEMTQGAIFVAHNVRFDYSFIKAEFERLGYTYSRKQLCTVRLARKAFPGLQSYSLDSLIAYFKLKVGDRHRAMGDTLATVDLFERIIQAERTDEDIRTMVNLGVKEALLPKNFSLERLHEIPEACGIYYFYNSNKEVIYVGKSINVKKRIAQHFSDKTEKASKLQQMVHDISWDKTGSELIALLLESHEIKRLRPVLNRAQKIRHFPYAIHSFYDKNGYLNLDVVKTTTKTRKQFQVLGEYPNLLHAKSWLKALQQKFELCLRLCHLELKNGACFDYHLKKCQGACIGEELPESYNTRAKAVSSALDKSFLEPNFFIIDKGRTNGENAIVLVENGIYRGFGYGDLTEMQGNLEELFDCVKNYDENPEVRLILRRFLAENQKLRLIKF
jgi:DNA polymerase-3 subunit epsilon